MAQGMFPGTDTGLLAWSLNFSTLITANPTSYGLVAADATDYAALHAAYATALAACDPGVRNRASVSTKNDARKLLKDAARLLAKRIDGTASVTNAQKLELGLTVRATPSPIPAPSEAPALDIVSVVGRTVKIRLHDSTDASRRGLPPLVAGATVFSYIGETAPTDPDAYTFQGNTTRTHFDVVFPESVAAGTKVWLTAFWRNERDMSGPACVPVGATIQYGLVMAG